ncbi:hypothetical protein M3J09_005568 [Ascochyta lentis]
MAVPADQTLLFTLPLELRQLIYKAVLASPLHGTELLRTCREIFLEARKFLFERPLSFRSQSALFSWLGRVPHEYLPQAKVLSLNIQDVDLRSILNASAPVSHPGDPPRLLTWDLYEVELERLYHALRLLPKIQGITIHAISGRQSFLYRECVQKVLRMLSSLYPDLTDLNLVGNFHHQSLSFLSRFEKLEAFSFDGFSASSPSQTAGVLAGLQHLTSLSLVSQSTMLAPDSRTHSDYTAKRQSFTGGVINKIDNLTCFSVTEIVPVASPTLFFTPEILSSLQKHQSLRTLKELWIRATSAADAFDIVWSIAESRNAGDVHALYELVLVRSTRTYGIASPLANDRKDSGVEEAQETYEAMCTASDDMDAINVGRAQRYLQALGVRVSWFTEQS